MPRATNSVLSDAELKFFYEKILLFYENDSRTNYGDFESIKRELKKTEGLQGIDFIYENYQEKMNEPQDNVFYFSAESETGAGKKKNSEIGKKLFGHLRNAFAHNYITKENEYVILQDYQNTDLSARQTLYAKLSSFNKFETLVNKIQEIIREKSK